ncbi:MAG: hypothetical protein H0V43_07840 [Gemmatimonadales bacterium]|nr:hypothetical protein [Gemmatimonadales bacterium]
MTSPARTLTILAVLGFVAFLLWSTLAAQRVECTVTVEFRGERRTATASATAEDGAVEQGQTAACGPRTDGMDASIACSRVPPVARQCRAL